MENYNFSFNSVKGMKEYKFTEVYTNEQILNYKRILNVETHNVLAVLQIGNIDIELIVTDLAGGEIKAIYQILAKENEFDWDVKEWLDFIPEEYSEENMFYKLINYAKEHNLYWSKLNS